MDIDDRYNFEIQHDIAFLQKRERQITLFRPYYVDYIF